MSSIAELYATYRDFDLLVDSRRLVDPARTLFFALGGQRTDGHAYIAELIERGVRHFVVGADFSRLQSSKAAKKQQPFSPTSNYLPSNQETQTPKKEEETDTISYHRVKDPLFILQQLAAHHRRQFDIPVVAITGSNGKTIVKDWLVKLLGSQYRVCASPRSFNSQIGVPLSLWQLNKTHEIGVFEAGISETGEMEKLAKIIQPVFGIFTNIGAAHQAGFRSKAHKLTEKVSLFTGVEWVLVPGDEAGIIAAVEGLGPLPTPARLGARSGGLARGESSDAAGTQKVHLETWQTQGEHRVEVGDFQLELPAQLRSLPLVFQRNAMTAIAAAHLLGLGRRDIIKAAQNLAPLDLRLAVRKGRNDCTIINDTYSNDLTSLAAALQFAQSQSGEKKISLVLTDLPQSKERPEQLYAQVARLIDGRVEELIGVGEAIPVIKDYLSGIPLTFFPDTTTLGKSLSDFRFQSKTILLKGARSFGLERLVDQLTERKHRTQLEIDLTALDHNLNIYKNLLNKDVKLAVMIKASAYGSGSIPVARLLDDRQVDYLVVAYTDEGVTLREAGISSPIMVLNPEASELRLLQKFALEPVVAETGLLYFLAGRQEIASLKLHLEFDTGMRRLGFSTDDLPVILEQLRRNHQLQLTSVFTHLAGSEAAEHDEYTRNQISVFQAVTEKIETAGFSIPIRHVLNTNGVSRFPDAQFEMVRLGIGFYGVGDEQQKKKLKMALRLKAQISGIREVNKDATIGYGRRGKLARDSRIGVLSIGYADGLPRSAGEGRFSVLINGALVPTVGSICMDMCMVDLTDVPQVIVGDEAIIFGPKHSIELLAAADDTIPYEVLTRIGERVHRVYSGE